MDLGTFDLLSCPFCGAGLHVSIISHAVGDDVLYGTLTCGCRTYPIVEGIVILKLDDSLKEVCTHIRNGENKKALVTILALAPLRNRILNHLASDLSRALPGFGINEALLKALDRGFILDGRRQALSFPALLWHWNWGEEGIFFQYRFSTTGFISLLPYLVEASRRGGMVLDLCSGLGHLLFFLRKYVQERSLFAVDIDFRKLFISKEIFSNGSNHICLDANLPLPFKDKFFSTIFCSDAFHYIAAKSTAAREMERSIDNGGMIYLIHLHNALEVNPYPGSPLSPLHYIQLFNRLKVKFFPESFVIRSFLEENSLFLHENFDVEELQGVPELHLVAWNGCGELATYGGIWETLLGAMKNLRINPLYRIERKGADFHLWRKFPSPFFAYEQSFMRRLLPEKLTIPAGVVGESAPPLESFAEELIRKFVLIEVPARYSSDGFRAPVRMQGSIAGM